MTTSTTDMVCVLETPLGKGNCCSAFGSGRQSFTFRHGERTTKDEHEGLPGAISSSSGFLVFFLYIVESC